MPDSQPIKSKTSPDAGFSLFEMIITLLISGLVLTIILALMRPLMYAVPIRKTEDRIKTVEDALVTHLQQFGHLPCPASLTGQPGSSDFAKASDCTAPPVSGVVRTGTGRVSPQNTRYVRIGAVPVRTLNLTTDYMRDGWDNRITYAVTEKLAQPGKYDNSDGGIFIRDSSGNDMTSSPGNVLYVLVSHGDDEKGAFSREGVPGPMSCGNIDLDHENCDGDATFVTSLRSLGPMHYDDLMSYKAFIGEVVLPTCGNKGMIYGPAHPEADADDCVDPSYKRHGQETVTGNYSVSCTSSLSFCTGSWITLANLVPGDYLIHWSGFLRFDYAQPSQYAQLEFEVDGQSQRTEKMPFTGTVCIAPGLLQQESGLVDFRVSSDSDLRVRMKYFGGINNPSANGCSGSTPSLNLVESGTGMSSATKTLSVDLFRKPQTFP